MHLPDRTTAGAARPPLLTDVIVRGTLRRAAAPGDRHAHAPVPTGLDRELLAVVDASVATAIPTGLVVALPGAAVPMLLAAATLVGAVAQTRRTDVSVAVVSRQLRLRPFYDTLHMGTIPLAAAIPRASIGPAGPSAPVLHPTLQRLGRTAGAGRTYLTGDADRLTADPALLAGLAGIVVDSSAATAEQTAALLAATAGRAVPLLYVTADPDDPVLDALRAADGVVWAWDATRLADLACYTDPLGRPYHPDEVDDSDDGDDLRHPDDVRRVPADAAGIVTDPDVLALAATSRLRVAGPATETALDEALAGAWACLRAAQTHPGAGPPGRAFAALAWVWGAYTLAATLPTTIDVYDRAARRVWGTPPLGDSPARAAAYARAATSDTGRDLWLRIADALRILTGALAANPKAALLRRFVTDTLTSPDDGDNASAGTVEESRAGRLGGLIVVKNGAAVRATVDTLDADPAVPYGWSDRIAVATAADALLGRVTVDDDPAGSALGLGVQLPARVCITGPLPRRFAGLLALTPAADVTVLAAGPWEAARTARTVQRARARLHELAWAAVDVDDPAAACNRLGVHVDAGTWAPLTVDHRVDVVLDDTVLDAAVLDALLDAPTRAGAEGGWDPFSFDVLAAAAQVTAPERDALRAGDDVDAPARDADGTATATVAALRVGCHDGILLLEPNDVIRRRAGDDIAEVAAKSLRAGDVVVLVDAAARRGLFDVIVDRLAELHPYASLVDLIDRWQSAAAAGGAQHTYADILARIRADGSKITTEGAVGHWCRGVVIGPADPADIARFARAVGDRRLAEAAAPIGAALQVIRRVRRTIGRWLAALIDGADPDRVGGLVDADLGIHVADLTDTITIHRVTAVAADLIDVPVTAVGVLLPPDTDPAG